MSSSMSSCLSTLDFLSIDSVRESAVSDRLIRAGEKFPTCRDMLFFFQNHGLPDTAFKA